MSYFKIFSLQTREEVFVIAGPYSQYFFSYDPELSSRKSIKRFVFFFNFLGACDNTIPSLLIRSNLNHFCLSLSVINCEIVTFRYTCEKSQ